MTVRETCGVWIPGGAVVDGAHGFDTWDFTALPSGRWVGHCDDWDLCLEAASCEELHALVQAIVTRLAAGAADDDPAPA